MITHPSIYPTVHPYVNSTVSPFIDPCIVNVHLDAKLYPKVLEREQRHVDAFLALSQGNTPKSNKILANIGVNYPRGIM